MAELKILLSLGVTRLDNISNKGKLRLRELGLRRSVFRQTVGGCLFPKMADVGLI